MVIESEKTFCTKETLFMLQWQTLSMFLLPILLRFVLGWLRDCRGRIKMRPAEAQTSLTHACTKYINSISSEHNSGEDHLEDGGGGLALAHLDLLSPSLLSTLGTLVPGSSCFRFVWPFRRKTRPGVVSIPYCLKPLNGPSALPLIERLGTSKWTFIHVQIFVRL